MLRIRILMLQPPLLKIYFCNFRQLAAPTTDLLASAKFCVSQTERAFERKERLNNHNCLDEFLLRCSDLEVNFVSVERCVEYSKLPQESGGAGIPPAGWPSSAAVNVSGIGLRYRSNLPLALDGLSFEVPGQKKVALVGAWAKEGCCCVQHLMLKTRPKMAEQPHTR